MYADNGVRVSSSDTDRAVSEGCVSDTAQLGAITPVLFAAMPIRDGKWGWPVTTSAPSSS